MSEWPHGVVHMGGAARPVRDREAGLLVVGIRVAQRNDQACMERRFYAGRGAKNLGCNCQEPRIPRGCLEKALEQVRGRQLDPLDWMNAAARVAEVLGIHFEGPFISNARR